jgi:hypothetical protein
MTPRNPEESPNMDPQNRVLRDIHDTINNAAHAAPASQPHGTPVPVSQQREAVDTKLPLDRVEAYLKGPTVFSA